MHVTCVTNTMKRAFFYYKTYGCVCCTRTQGIDKIVMRAATLICIIGDYQKVRSLLDVPSKIPA